MGEADRGPREDGECRRGVGGRRKGRRSRAEAAHRRGGARGRGDQGRERVEGQDGARRARAAARKKKAEQEQRIKVASSRPMPITGENNPGRQMARATPSWPRSRPTRAARPGGHAQSAEGVLTPSASRSWPGWPRSRSRRRRSRRSGSRSPPKPRPRRRGARRAARPTRSCVKYQAEAEGVRR